MPNPLETKTLEKLEAHYQQTKTLHMRDLFNANPNRHKIFSLKVEDILLDYSKNRITEKTMDLLFNFAREMELELWRDRMFDGKPINHTENRAVLHIALRNRSNRSIFVNHQDVMPNVRSVLDKIATFAHKIRYGDWKGYTGKKILDVVNIGIGGSDLGPHMVVRALKPYQHKQLNFHFLSNVDGMHFLDVMRSLNPETTLFIVASKTFTTEETMTNAHSARKWFLKQAKNKKHIKQHFVAVSTHAEKVRDFGIDTCNMFEFWDWVGGRYSLWSAVGLPIVLAVGMKRFIELLEGAHAMDEHFRQTPLEKNMPVILGLLGVWYNNFYQAESCAILPYDHQLNLFPTYLEQADMESNGKSVNREGLPINYSTGSIVWGAQGINGQHAFYQLIHQGTKLIPTDFISTVIPHEKLGKHHDIMISNFLAQTEALMIGRTQEETKAALKAANISIKDAQKRLPHMIFKGNNPSNSILFREITPRSLGSLIALYEHKIFVQGILWNLNSYDQWGVELGN